MPTWPLPCQSSAAARLWPSVACSALAQPPLYKGAASPQLASEHLAAALCWVCRTIGLDADLKRHADAGCLAADPMNAMEPAQTLGPHVASLGMTFVSALDCLRRCFVPLRAGRVLLACGICLDTATELCL